MVVLLPQLSVEGDLRLPVANFILLVEVDDPLLQKLVLLLQGEPIDAAPHVFRFITTCSSGTYVRTLAADIGAELGGGAHLRYLRRTAIGSHTEAAARPLGRSELITLADGLRDLASLVVDDVMAERVRNGQRLERARFEGPGPWVLLDESGDVLAVHERVEDGRIKAAVVVPAGQ